MALFVWFQSTHPWRVRLTSIFPSLPFPHISIHAPMKGATWILVPLSQYLRQFQSTHPWRVRQDPALLLALAMKISIHAPMKGATHNLCHHMASLLNFNPRTHEGCDPLNSPDSTGLPDFNPRTHEGCDRDSTIQHRLAMLFQSTHPWRVRRYWSNALNGTKFISIHAPMKGATVFKLTQSSPAFLSSILRTERKTI